MVRKLFKIFVYSVLKFCHIHRKRLAFPVFRSNVYSQDGDDGIIEFIMSKMSNIPRYIIDIGANDGVYCSNSRLLITKYHFKGLLIEPFVDAFESLRELYKKNLNISLSKKAVGASACSDGSITWHGHFSEVTVPIFEINDVLKENDIPKEIGFLSIDTDGHDNEILMAIDWYRYRTWFIIAEIDSSSYKNLQAQIDIMDSVGFIPLFHIGNVFYCRKDIAGQFLFNWREKIPNEFGFFIT